MRKLITVLTLSVFTALVGTSAAFAETIEPGLWHMTITGDAQIVGSPNKIPVNSANNACIKAGENLSQALMMHGKKMHCLAADEQTDGSKHEITFNCISGEGSSVQKGWYSASKDELKSEWTLTDNLKRMGHSFTSTMNLKIDGNYVGKDCDSAK